MNAAELNEALLPAENALAQLSQSELETLLKEIGYSSNTIDVLVQYQTLTKAFREKMGLM
ncbi:TPA: hypothetical protein ACK3JJ_001589 [Mannheimia haemolytica]